MDIFLLICGIGVLVGVIILKRKVDGLKIVIDLLSKKINK
jgi:hypothetical protein